MRPPPHFGNLWDVIAEIRAEGPAESEETNTIYGSGEMAERIRQADWSRTPLGPREQWSATLVTCINVMLAAPGTFALYWGPEQILLYNDEYKQLLHEKHPAALGKTGREIWAEAWHVIEPPMRAALEHGRTTHIAEAYIPILAGGATRDGWFSYGFFPIHHGGAVVGIGNTGQDITEAVQDRERLRVTREKLELAMEVARQGAFSFEATTGLVSVDSMVQALFEMPESAGPAEYWISRVHPDDQQMARDAFAAAATGERPYEIEHRIVRSDGVRWIEARARLTSAPGEPVALTGICEDTTLRKAQREALQQTEKLAAVGKLAASIAHEINNPLESVTNLLYLARNSADLAEVQGYLATAEQELRRVSIISSQTLRFHRQSSAATTVTCIDLFATVLSIYQGRLINSNIVVEKRKRAHKAVECFEGEIRQVLSNLVGNAIDAMHPGGGRLLLRSRDTHDWRTGQPGLALTVADTGTGMPAKVLTQIFDAFYTTKGIGGTGLGLWISQEIIARHQGSLRVRSATTAGRHGTVFVLFLPLLVAER